MIKTDQIVIFAECSQHITSAFGELKLIRFPDGYKSVDDKCEIYVTGMPHTFIQFVFKDFKLTGLGDSCGTYDGLLASSFINIR